MVVDLGSHRIRTLCAAIHDAGLEVVRVLTKDEALLETAEQLQPNVVIVAAESCSRDSLRAIEPLHGQLSCPLFIVLSRDDPKLHSAAIAAGMSAVVVESLSPALLRTLLAVSVMRQGREKKLREELHTLREKLDRHQVIDRARCLLMEQHGLSEREAYNRLRSAAMHRGIAMTELARQIMLAAAS